MLLRASPNSECYGHWGIQNTCHWTLDMTFREDENRTRDRCVRENHQKLTTGRPAAGRPDRQNLASASVKCQRAGSNSSV